jgi:hypothetical protein
MGFVGVSYPWMISGLGMTIPDYVAIGVLVVLLVWAVANLYLGQQVR